jgi:hypothetical protein
MLVHSIYSVMYFYSEQVIRDEMKEANMYVIHGTRNAIVCDQKLTTVGLQVLKSIHST